MDDDELLALVREERRQAIGIGALGADSGEMAAEVAKALEYIKGEMRDVPSLPNRSSAVDTAVADAIETALPDIMEIFVGGDDVCSFKPRDGEDEDQARLESEYVTSVIMDQNDGFMLFNTIVKDGLQSKIGITKSWDEDEDEREEQEHTVPAEAMDVLRPQLEAQGKIEDEEATEMETEMGIVPAVRFKLCTEKTTTCVKVVPVPPEDFGFARDTVKIRDASYCFMRARPRAQELVAQGYSREVVEALPAYTTINGEVEQARDTLSESQLTPDSPNWELRPVETVEHYIRLLDGDDLVLWKVVTGGNETVLLEKEKVTLNPFSVSTPYIITHRLVGRSLADLLLEIQRIKTALLRMLLDSGYFALNQRLEVSEQEMGNYTISDLLRNEPGVPIRSKTGKAVRAITAGGLDFDATGALEYVATVAEQRTGIVRNAQGLNPDTLHDTAKGAQQLIGAAQKRIRFVARVFAETGVKDMFLNVHELLRTRATPDKYQTSGEWKDVDPSTWKPRKGVQVDIGVGSGGREHDILAGGQLLQLMQTAAEGQASGVIGAPVVSPEGIYTALKRHTERLGFRNAEQYWTDPKNAPPKPPPGPDPRMVEAQAKMQIQEMAAQAKAQLADKTLMHQQQLAEFKATSELNLERNKNEMKLAHEQEMGRLKAQLDAAQRAAEIQQREREMNMEFALKARQSDRDHELKSASIDGPQVGGEPG